MIASDSAIPADAALIRDFVNSVEWREDRDEWTTPVDLDAWFSSHGMPSAPSSSSADLERARRLREGLRSALLMNAGHDPLADSIDDLNSVLEAFPLHLRFDFDGRVDLGRTSASSGLLAPVVAAIASLRADQSWVRLKACSRDSCRWAYWDASRNISGRWCSMAGCGNYVKMRRRNSPDLASGDVIGDAAGEVRAPTLLDVAARAGVSMKTASNVVTGAFSVAEPTRSRVQAAIDALGYQPNLVARALRARRTES